jgi:glucosamine--fructose-6-phosphate aminotransferase (isomerizing)
VLAFRQDDAAAGAMDETIARVVRAGSHVFTATPSGSGPAWLPVVATGHWATDPLSALLTFYRFAETVSRARGYDPDRPAQLSKVTRTV